MPNASFIGYTGTPIEKTDANTRAVFGDYISIYDIQRAVADKAMVPIYCESRISKLSLNAAELPKLDVEFEEITQGRSLRRRKSSRRSWPRWRNSFSQSPQLSGQGPARRRRLRRLRWCDLVQLNFPVKSPNLANIVSYFN